MKTTQELTQEISQLTLKIEQNYPELYQHLEENPITLTADDGEVSAASCQEYLDSLKSLIDSYKKNRKK